MIPQPNFKKKGCPQCGQPPHELLSSGSIHVANDLSRTKNGCRAHGQLVDTHLDKCLCKSRISTELAADTYPCIVSVACIDRHLDRLQDCRMMCIEEFLKCLILAVDRACVLCKVIGSDGEEVYQFCKLVSNENSSRSLDHDTYGDILLVRYIVCIQLSLCLIEHLKAGLDFPLGDDHREHDRDVAVCGCAKECAELCHEDLFTSQADTDRTEAQSRVLFLVQLEVIDLLVSADIKRTDDQLLACKKLSDLLVCLELLLFCRIVVILHSERKRPTPSPSFSRTYPTSPTPPMLPYRCT